LKTDPVPQKLTFHPEQIVGKMWQIELLGGQGKTVPLASKEAGITGQTICRWRKKCRGPQTGQPRKNRRIYNRELLAESILNPPDGLMSIARCADVLAGPLKSSWRKVHLAVPASVEIAAAVTG
jgi:hypothetical protein